MRGSPRASDPPVRVFSVAIALVLILVLLTAKVSWADSVIATVTVGTQPEGVALDSANGDVYVANYGSGTVSVITPTSTTTTTSSSSSTTSSTSQTSSSSTRSTRSRPSTSGGGDIPEFPFQLGLATLVTFAVVAAYVLTRRSVSKRPKLE